MADDLLAKQVNESIQALRLRGLVEPRIAIILGTGLGRLVEQMQPDLIVPFSEIPHFPRATAMGHKGQLVCGKLADADVVALDGRFHFYEGYTARQITFPVHVMRRLGAGLLIASNASGAVNPRFQRGDIVLIESHIDLMWQRSRLLEPVPEIADRNGRRQHELYDPRLAEQSLAIARAGDFPAHRGVYVGVVGPNYETRAEYRFFRRIGGDVVGMSTIPEVTAAAQLGMRILGISIVTNVATPDVLKKTDANEVISTAESAATNVGRLVSQVVAEQENF